MAHERREAVGKEEDKAKLTIVPFVPDKETGPGENKGNAGPRAPQLLEEAAGS